MHGVSTKGPLTSTYFHYGVIEYIGYLEKIIYLSLDWTKEFP